MMQKLNFRLKRPFWASCALGGYRRGPRGPVAIAGDLGADSIFFVFGFFSYIVGSFLLAAPLVQMYVRSLCIYWDCNSHNNNLTRVYYMIYMWLIGIAVQTHMQRVIKTW